MARSVTKWKVGILGAVAVVAAVSVLLRNRRRMTSGPADASSADTWPPVPVNLSRPD